ncbi:MAG: hypothetical protein E7454_07580 [Ruminococcaceae bacterium]|nr:hypothetical protein [Oscillospiraceae bacterium]
MKRILALLLALVMLLCLTACGENPAEVNNPASSNPSTGESSGSTGSTTPSSEATQPSTNPSEPASSEHKHSYASDVTTAATCGKDGVKTFTCSCGDSYTEKIAATGQHSWGSWTLEAKAYVGKDGTEKRTCKTCSASETRKTTDGALNNSFVGNVEFEWFMSEWPSPNGGTLVDIPYNAEGIQGGTLLNYVGAFYNGSYRDNMDFSIPLSAVVEFLKPTFAITDALKAEMKADYRYDSATDSFNLTHPGSSGIVTAWVEGYIHTGGNKYAVYYGIEQRDGGFIPQYWKAEIEYNLLNGNPNKYLSFVGVESLPSNLTK